MRTSLYAVVGGLMLGAMGVVLPAQSVPPMTVVPMPTPRVSKYETMLQKTGLMLRRDVFVLPTSHTEWVPARVVRLEDVKGQQVVFSLEVELPEKKGVAIVSEEEMGDLKETVDSIVENMPKINASSNPVRVEYKALSGAAFGYAVHRRTADDQELPPTAYVEVPHNPYIPLGGLQRLSPESLQRMVADAQKIMEEQRGKK